MGILMMDSMGWPYDSFDCLLYSQMVGWWVVQHGKCRIYAKRVFFQSFRIDEKKLARRHTYLVYKGKSWILQCET